MGFGFGNCTKLHKRPAANQPAACQPGLLVCLHKSSSSALVRLSRYPECTSSLSNPLYLYLSFTLPCTGCTSSLSNPSANWRPPLLRTAGVAGLMQQCTHRIAPSQAQMNSALFQNWMYWLALESRLHSTLCVRSAILACSAWCCLRINILSDHYNVDWVENISVLFFNLFKLYRLNQFRWLANLIQSFKWL